MLKLSGETLFPAKPTGYARFMSLMHRTEVVFLPKYGPLDGATLLLPGMPVSEGVLPVIGQRLGLVDGTAALITDLTHNQFRPTDKLILYTLQQVVEYDRPKVRITRREVSAREMAETADGLALMGDEFGDETKGWALVHMRKESCSSQTVVTRCTYYQQFSTEEALQEAAQSYGGLTRDVI